MQKDRAYILKADNIERCRQLKALTHEELAKRAGVTTRTLQRWIGGQAAYLSNVASLAQALEVPPQSLLIELQPVTNELAAPPIVVPVQVVANTSPTISVTVSGTGREVASELRRLARCIEEALVRFENRDVNNETPTEVEYDRTRKVLVMYIPGFDESSRAAAYFFVLVAESLYEKTIESIDKGRIPPWAVVIDKGYGEPTNPVIHKIKTEYGFDYNEQKRIADEREVNENLTNRSDS